MRHVPLSKKTKGNGTAQGAKEKMRLGYRESNPGLMRLFHSCGSESHRCYRYTIPDESSVVPTGCCGASQNLGLRIHVLHHLRVLRHRSMFGHPRNERKAKVNKPC